VALRRCLSAGLLFSNDPNYADLCTLSNQSSALKNLDYCIWSKAVNDLAKQNPTQWRGFLLRCMSPLWVVSGHSEAGNCQSTDLELTGCP
jgi:hypothetical protein